MSELVRIESTQADGRRRRSTQVIRADLLAAATELFAQKGLEAVNSNQIARAAGVGVGTFYNHFRDKHEIQVAILLDTLDRLRLAIARNGSGSGDGVREQVRTFVETIVGFAAENPERFRVAFGSEAPARRALGPSDGERAARPQVGFSTRATERRLVELQRHGELDPALHPGVAARAFIAMQNGVITWWLEDQSRATREQIVATLIRLHPAVVGARAASV